MLTLTDAITGGGPYIAVLLLWNVVVMAIYGLDKRRAQTKKWRIPEKTLLLCAFLGGGIGALLGMLTFRHKTKHLKFTILLPIACLLTIILMVALLGLGA